MVTYYHKIKTLISFGVDRNQISNFLFDNVIKTN